MRPIEGDVLGGRPQRLTTLLAAGNVPAAELAQLYADQPWPAQPELRSTADDLEQLATVRSLALRLRDQVGPLVHRAILRGAHPAEVAAAVGLGVVDAHRMWSEWAHDQRMAWLTTPRAPAAPADVDQVEQAWQDARHAEGVRR